MFHVEKFRSSHPEVLCKKDVLKNFAKFKGKHLHQSLFFNKITDLRPAALLKKGLRHRCFPLKNTFFIETLRWLLLKVFLLFDICSAERPSPICLRGLAMHKKLIFPIRIYSVNVTKSGFGHIY